jgi:hypothetical protein
VQIGRVRFARVELHDHAFIRKIDNDIEYSRYFHEHWPEFADAFVAIFALGRDLDGLNDRVVGAFGIERVARFGLVGTCGVHQLGNARRALSGCNFACNWLQNAPDILGENLLAGGIRMDAIRLIQVRIAADAFE